MTELDKIVSLLYELNDQSIKKVYRFAKILFLESKYTNVLQKEKDIFLDMTNLELFDVNDDEFEKILFERNLEYTARMKAILDYNQSILEARQEGKQEGLKQSREETRIAMTIKMLQKEFDIDTIMELSQLSLAEIEELKKNI